MSKKLLQYYQSKMQTGGKVLPMYAAGDPVPSRYAPIPRASDVPRMRPVQQMMTAEQARRQNAYNNNGTIRPAQNQNKVAKALAIAANPFTAASYVVKGQRIPDNFEKGSTNNYDIAGSILNPFSVIDAASKTPDAIRQGDYLGAAMNMVDIVPGVVTVPKSVRAGLNQIDKLSPVGRRLNAIQREGRLAGMNDFDIARRQMDEVGITSNQRQGYVPGVSDLARKYITPYGYTGMTSYGNTGMASGNKLKEIWQNIKRGGINYGDEIANSRITPARADAWSMYLGFPQRNKTFRMAETAPVNHRAYSNKQLQNMDLYSLNNEAMIADELSRGANSTTPAGINKAIDNLKADSFVEVDPVDVMGNFNARFTGDGVQYNDIWDLNPSIAPVNLVPYKVKELFDNSNLFYKKSYFPGSQQAMYAPRRINIDVSKYFGKPFMSHGNINNMSAAKYKNKLLQNIENRISYYSSNPETANVFAPKVEMLNDKVNQLNNIQTPFEDGGTFGGGGRNNSELRLDRRRMQSPADNTRQVISPKVMGLYQDYAYAADQFNKAKSFHSRWMDSPMYKKMIGASDPVNAQRITDLRRSNLKSATFRYVPEQPKDEPDTGGYSNRKTGRITFLPLGVGVRGMGTHEMSHSIDRPEASGNIQSALKKLFTGESDASRAIPQSDIYRIHNISSENYKGNRNMSKEDSEWFDYVTNPTETRARLNDVRQQALQYGLYDPFTQKVTPEIYRNKLKNFKFEQGKNRGFDALRQLRGVYTDDQIIYLLNSVSQNESQIGLDQAKDGGQHGGLDRWFAEKWVDVKSGKPCGRQEGENRAYPACRPSRRVNSGTPKTSSEMSPAEKARFKREKTSSQRISYNHKRR